MDTELLIVNRPIEFRNAAEGSNSVGTLGGYAAVFYDADRRDETEYRLDRDLVERISPTAFDETIENDDIAALFDHDTKSILGKLSADTLRVETDKVGLRYEIDLPNTSLGRDLAELVERGDITGSSFGFRVKPGGEKIDRDEADYVRELRAVTVRDVGPVSFAAYSGATCGMRSAAIAEVRSRCVADLAEADLIVNGDPDAAEPAGILESIERRNAMADNARARLAIFYLKYPDARV